MNQRDSSAAQGHEIAFGILCAALGEPRAWSLWNRWTADQRNGVAEFAESHFGAQIRSLADELIAWEERHANT
jgi:hypothetical protein